MNCGHSIVNHNSDKYFDCYKSFVSLKMVFNKLAKKLSKVLSPKKIGKMTRKAAPKLATGGLILGAGIGAEKLLTMNEDQPILTAEAPEDSNMIDQSYTLVKIEDVANGKSSSLMTPSRVTTIVMFVLIMFGMIIPMYKLYKRTVACLQRRRQANAERRRLVEDNPVRNKNKDRRTVSGKDLEDMMKEDDQDSKVLASIARQEVTFEGGNVSRERRIQMLEEEIEILNNSRKTE